MKKGKFIPNYIDCTAVKWEKGNSVPHYVSRTKIGWNEGNEMKWIPNYIDYTAVNWEKGNSVPNYISRTTMRWNEEREIYPQLHNDKIKMNKRKKSFPIISTAVRWKERETLSPCMQWRLLKWKQKHWTKITIHPKICLTLAER